MGLSTPEDWVSHWESTSCQGPTSCARSIACTATMAGQESKPLISESITETFQPWIKL
jgi:hypothetical protein